MNIQQVVVTSISEVLLISPDSIVLSETLDELGADSLDLVELIIYVEEEFDLSPISEDGFEITMTVQQFIDNLQVHVQKAA